MGETFIIYTFGLQDLQIDRFNGFNPFQLRQVVTAVRGFITRHPTTLMNDTQKQGMNDNT